MRSFGTLFMALAFFYSGSTFAVCGLSITANNIAVTWDLTFSSATVQLTLTKANAPACDYWVGVTKGGAASAATRRMTTGVRDLSYQLYKENAFTNILKDSSDAPITSANEVITGAQLPAGINVTQTLFYYFKVPFTPASSTLIKDGTYTDSFTLNVYEGADPTVPAPTPVTSQVVTATVTVPKTIRLSLVPSGSGFDDLAINRSMAFGILAPGQWLSFDMRVRTNAGFIVTFSSANNGRLKPPTNPAATGVPYSFYANSSLLNLTNSKTVPVAGPTATGTETSLQGTSFPIRVVVGSFDAATSLGGAHEDIITITATTTD